MKIKQFSTIVLLVFVAASLAYMIGREQKSKPSDNPNEPASVTQEQSAKPEKPSVSRQDETVSSTTASSDDLKKTRFIVYYFHGDVRCSTCHKLETYAKEALDTYFADEVASKDIIWKVINVDKSENRHFVQDYRLVTKSVVLSEVTGGKENRWKNLDLIWQKVGDKDGYLQYIRDSILEFLQGAKS